MMKTDFFMQVKNRKSFSIGKYEILRKQNFFSVSIYMNEAAIVNSNYLMKLLKVGKMKISGKRTYNFGTQVIVVR